MKPRHVPTLALMLLLALKADAAPGDPAKDMKDKDFKVRILAIEELVAKGGREAEALLVAALRDEDWQVMERAAEALGRKGTSASVDDLVALAVEGPIRRVRITAARAAGKLGSDRAIELLGRKVNGDFAFNAIEAVGAIATTNQNEAAAKVIDDAIRPSKKHELEKPSGGRERDPIRRAAAGSFTAFPVAGRVARTEKVLFDADIAVACAALDTIVEIPDPAFVPMLISGLAAPKLDDCVERRVRNALRAIVAMKPPGPEALEAARPVLDAIRVAPNADAAARLARLVGDLAKAPRKDPDAAADAKPALSLIDADAAVNALGPATTHADAKVRAAAAAAMGKINTDLSIAQAVSLASQDKDARVRLIGLRALASTITATDTRAFKVFQELLSDADPLVREEAAVAMGVKGVTGAIPSLQKLVAEAIADKKGAKWALGTSALVSMGKTEDVAACEPLRTAFKEARDWRLKASAVVGMGRVQKVEAVPDLIDALDDVKTPSVHATAFEFLRRLTSKEMPEDSKTWREWWKANEKNYQFLDRDAEFRKARKYGYAPTVEGLYEGLDIVVLATRGGGDRIEDLLQVMRIKHRLCRAPQVMEANLHPYALFVANCPGEIGEEDVQALAWFVRAGGHLFSSCWSLHEVIEKAYPGMVKRFPTPTAQVIDYNVNAAPCVPDSPYLDGVFDAWTQPKYVLEGAHLIEVLDRDRVEVLIDSPDSATSWGSGNMACWFTAGHGVILDSVNHFNHQGFHFATGLKTAEDRMAFAMDHMGTTYADLRDFAAKKVFESSSKAAKEVTDESAFRFISNFVRFKRRVDL